LVTDNTKGDTLVCDASDGLVKAGQTDGRPRRILFDQANWSGVTFPVSLT
jgi:hypothetical protein